MNETAKPRFLLVLSLILALARGRLLGGGGEPPLKGASDRRRLHPDRPERPPGQRPRFRRALPDRLFRLQPLPRRLPDRPRPDRPGAGPLREEATRRAAARVQPIFITVDPERDTPAVLKPLCRRLPPAADRPHRHAGADRRRGQEVRHLLCQGACRRRAAATTSSTAAIVAPVRPARASRSPSFPTRRAPKRWPPSSTGGSNEHAFWEKPLAELDRGEWEALCDGCGKCCLHKLEDDETGEVHATNVACRLLDRHSGRCTNYRGRRAFVPDCIRLTAAQRRQARPGCPRPAPTGCAPRASRCPTGII